MKAKRYILTFLLLTVPLFNILATPQAPDLIIYKGDTLLLFACPLEQLYNDLARRPKLFGNREVCLSTGCWRGYQAQWTIVENQLYLTGIFSCCFYEDSIKTDLSTLFGAEYINGKVKADWFSGDVIASFGKELCFFPEGNRSIYAKELELKFSKGRLVDTTTYDNSKSRQSAYSQKATKLMNFLYSNIHWEVLPIQDKAVKVFLQFSADENGIIDTVKVLRGYDAVFDKEAIRTVKSIPEWNIFYVKGKHQRSPYNIALIFNEENRTKYKK